MLLNEEERKPVWDFVRDELKFHPDSKYRGHSRLPWRRPFRLPHPWAVYGIEDMTQEQIDGMGMLVKNCFLRVTRPGERLYALDWQHDGFLFDPRNEEEQRSLRLEDETGEYWAEFPFWYPDGDYYFFLDEQFRFGYLGHPWRKEIWVYGGALLSEIARIAPELGWKKLR